MAKILKRDDAVDIENVDEGLANKWSWQWVEKTVDLDLLKYPLKNSVCIPREKNSICLPSEKTQSYILRKIQFVFQGESSVYISVNQIMIRLIFQLINK